MLIGMHRVIPSSIMVLLTVCCCVLGDGLAGVPEGDEKAQKVLIEPTRDIKQGREVVEEREGENDNGQDAGTATPGVVEVGPSLSRAENLSPLLSREYLAQFDIPIVFNEAVDYFIRYFTVQRRKVFVNWLKRARRYAPTIRGILREQGLPEDLVYLAMIESGFNPKAYSPMKACGPWQFIYETGERYGLRVNWWIDERRDPQKSTVAAARYLKDLFNQFGCWYLAAAGYNAGEGRIERAIAKHETNDFWELRKFNTLPRETREYIPQLIAAAIIAKDPEKFGLYNIPFDAPIPSAVYRVPGGTPLSLIAKAGHLSTISLHALNPEILRGITPPDADSYLVRLPRTVDGEGFSKRLRAMLEDGSRVLGVTAHVAKRRDTVAKITKQYRVSVSDLMLVNLCGENFSVRPGSPVYIPRFERDGRGRQVEQSEDLDKKPAFAVRSIDAEKTVPNKSYHVAKRGEKLQDIARRYQVDVERLREINNLRTDRIRPNTRILLVSGTASKPAIKSDERSGTRAGNRSFHIVKKGESLADISERYGTDLATLRKINKLRRDRIVPNMRLQIAAAAEAQATTEKAGQARSDRSQTIQTRAVRPRPIQIRSVKLYHVVKKGENLTDISEKYSVNVTSLKKMNGLKKDGLRPGMRLRVASR